MLESRGCRAPGADMDAFKKCKFILKGNRFTILESGHTEDRGHFYIDPITQPKKMTIQSEVILSLGIYSLQGDVLKVRWVADASAEIARATSRPSQKKKRWS